MSLLSQLDQDQLLMHAFDYAPIGKSILTLDGHFLKVNQAGQKFLGYGERELNGLHFQDLVHPDDLYNALEHFDELVNRRRASYTRLERLIHKSGQVLWTYISVTLVDQGDEAPYIISQFIDATTQLDIDKQLVASENNYQLIINHSMDMITKVREGCFSFVSASSQSLLGYKPEEMVGTRADTFYHPKDRDMIRMFYEELKRQRKGTVTYRARHRDGNYLWFETTSVYFETESGEVEILSFSRDVTPRKEAQLALKEKEQRLNSLIENHPDMVYSLDLDGHFTTFNRSCRAILGYSEEWILNPPKSFHFLVFPEDLSKVSHHFNLAKNGEVQQFESRMVIQCGEVLTIDHTFIPIIINDEVKGVYGISKNIEESKRYERELKRTRNRLEAFIHNHLDAILIFNAKGQLIKVNEPFEKLLGWKGEIFLGKSITELPFIPKQEYSTLHKKIKMLKMGQDIGHVETIRVKRDGSVIDTLVSGFPIREAGKFMGWAATYRDITDRKKAEALMIHSEKLSVAGQLAAGIAHEIRNPLTAIKGFLQFLKSDSPSNKEYFNIMSSEIERIESIVSELLMLAKPQKLVHSLSDVKTLLSEVITLLDSQAILNNVQIRLDAPSCACEIHCEPNQLKQVFINFIKNAIEAMPDGGQLAVKLTKNCSQLGYHIEFQDEGKGMSQELIEKLGQPFYTTKDKGTGLGFMVSKKIIEDHQGRVVIESKVDCGTTITIYLPHQPSMNSEQDSLSVIQ
ncbi:PAS domain S-box protein [Pullulanibacillus sp. KACC 23026]|uniref:PAS domain S-box protein n=1 Tax=Pullulanibacillus sp. KACC 23026 TaxID=3028315 RepID=UPI0023AE9CDD|nr:PAS domain S-box protein [Pullulanibacillus sp. KACC 23026]WEG12318.1 PAS domain S-box protein [Pullulanibacillus sp. KACC 23026]